MVSWNVIIEANVRWIVRKFPKIAIIFYRKSIGEIKNRWIYWFYADGKDNIVPSHHFDPNFDIISVMKK